jgi:hypothetical protein
LQQSLVGSVVIGAKLGRVDHSSIPATGGANQKKKILFDTFIGDALSVDLLYIFLLI